MGKKFVILVDMDDTIECLTDAWLMRLNSQHGTHVTREDLTCWDFAKPFPTLTEEEVYAPLYDGEFWETVKPMQDACEVMKELIEYGHEIYIVTSSVHETISAKMTKVLFRYFPFIDWNHVIVAQKKQMIRGDILIDDGVHNLVGGDYVKILMTAPHNRDYDAEANDMIRVDSWEDIFQVIRSLSESSSGLQVGHCDVCGEENTEVVVCCSTCGAESFSYCKKCLAAGAEPYWPLVTYISMAGSRRDDINDAYNEIIDKTLNHLGIPEKRFWGDVRAVQ